jgi:hypothetical protein
MIKISFYTRGYSKLENEYLNLYRIADMKPSSFLAAACSWRFLVGCLNYRYASIVLLDAFDKLAILGKCYKRQEETFKA